MSTRRDERPRGSGRGRGRLGRIVKWLLIVGLVGGLLGVVAFFVAYRTVDVPSPNEEFLTQTTNVMYRDGSTELGSFATQRRESIPYDAMPQNIKDAVVAAENRSFWTDQGIDPKGIIRAAFNNAAGGSTQGASTITQQYVKVLYLTQDQTLTRKAKEAFLSLKIQRSMSKEEILEGYLNTIYFGRGAYGIQAASKAWFDKPAAGLNVRQSAVLASVINNPTRFDPANGQDNRAELEARYQYVLSGMADMGTITAAEYDHASRRLPDFPKIEAESQYGGQKGHALKLVRDELERLDIPGVDQAAIDGGGLRITTTLTPNAMRASEEGVTAVRPPSRSGPNLHAASATVETRTGALLGFYGGHDYLDSQINWAVTGGMAGSTMKAFTDAAAIKQGFSLTDTFDGNSPIDIGGTEFENQGDASYGSAISMLAATQDSVNTAFIDMVNSMDNGPRAVIDTARSLGIPGNQPAPYGIPNTSRDLQENVGVTLGTARISPINMATAYGSIANGGRRAQVHVVKEVRDRNGKVLYRFDDKPKRVLDEDIAADVSYALQQVVQGGSGTQALNLGRPAAGKTGTATNDNGYVSSSWFVGYTPQVSTAVMYVRGDGDDGLDAPTADGSQWMPASSDGQLGYFGGNYPAKTWTEIMQTVMEDRPVEDFPPPVYVDGEAPDSGHEPYVPPAEPEPEPEPTQRPEPSAPETSEPPPSPTQPSEPPTTSAPPSPTQPPSPTPPQPSDTDGPIVGPPSTPPGQDSTPRGRGRGRAGDGL